MEEETSEPVFDEEIYRDAHISYVKSLDIPKDDFEYVSNEHLRVSGIYWGMSALDLLNVQPNEEEANKIVEFLSKCQQENGGFGGNVDHDPHLLYTLSAIQILAMMDKLDDKRINIDKAAKFVSGLQQKDGSFFGDKWGEVDTRFSYCAVCAMSILGKLDLINTKSAVDFVLACRNFDEAFGNLPDAESHAGQTFCSLGMLAMLNAVEGNVNVATLSWWLSERQTSVGGLNGRPEKKPDVCYSWWVLSCLSILNAVSWIDCGALREFILSCQDKETGGISDRPGDMVDVYHTFFGLAGLSLLGDESLGKIDPVFALPIRVVDRLGLHNVKS